MHVLLDSEPLLISKNSVACSAQGGLLFVFFTIWVSAFIITMGSFNTHTKLDVSFVSTNFWPFTLSIQFSEYLTNSREEIN